MQSHLESAASGDKASDKKPKLRKNMVGEKSDKGNGVRWIVVVTILSFFLSVLLSTVSNAVLAGVALWLALLIILLIVVVNILFDIIGTAVTAADEKPFHAMASRKKYGAKQAIRFVRNADKVSNISNDVIGDICGIISGSATAYVIINVMHNSQNVDTISLVITGIVSALTVGGKAFGKTVAIRFSNDIVYKVAVVVAFIEGLVPFIKKKRSSKR